jgi:hypothetical protein
MARVSLGGEPPAEVLRFFRDKQLRPRFSWLDVWAEEHGYAFTVAKATETDVLTAFRGAIDRALERGLPFEQFRRDITAELARIGWGGPHDVRDPDTGEVRRVDFTAPRRLRTIFWSNMRAARAAGQWERAQRTKRMLPFFLYVETTADDPRIEHLDFVGIILPVDHPFWRTHFPPNGWGCKCAVRQITAAEAKRLLARPEGQGGITYRDTPPPIVRRSFVNRRTGEVTEVPLGIDPGWHTNPGLARAETLMRSLSDRLEESGEAAAREQIGKLWDSNLPAILTKLPQRVHMPVAVAPRVARVMGSKGRIVSISNSTLATKLSHRERRIADFAGIQGLIDRGTLRRDPRRSGAWLLFGAIGQVFFRLSLGLSRGAQLMHVRTLHPIGRQPERMRRMIAEAGDDPQEE